MPAKGVKKHPAEEEQGLVCVGVCARMCACVCVRARVCTYGSGRGKSGEEHSVVGTAGAKALRQVRAERGWRRVRYSERGRRRGHGGANRRVVQGGAGLGRSWAFSLREVGALEGSGPRGGA